MNRNTFFTLFIRVKKCTPFVNTFFYIFLLSHSRMSQQPNLVFHALPQRAYARQAHLAGNEATPTIAFFDVPTTGMYLDNEPSGEIGFSVKGTRKLLVGNGVRVDGNLIVDGAIIGGDGNAVVPIVDFGNLDHNIIPGSDDTYTLGDPTIRWSNVFINNMDVARDVDILGNLTVSGDTTFQAGFDRVDVNLLPVDDNIYSIGSTTKTWTDAYVGNINTTNVVTETLDTNTVTIQTSMTSNNIVSATGNITTFVSNSIIANVIQTSTILNDSGEEFVQIDLTQIDSNMEPVSNAVYSIGNTQNQWDTVHVRSIRSAEYLLDTGAPLEFPTDFGNISQDMNPASTATYSIGTDNRHWDNVWTNTIHTNVIHTSELLDLSGNTFIPEVNYNGLESNITPLTTGVYSLGNVDHRWDTLWATELIGNLNAAQLYGNLSGDITLNGTITLSGVAAIQDGTEQDPSLAFSNEPGSGIYRPQANTIGFTVGGAQKLVITDTATISAVFGDANTVYYGDATNMTFPVDRLQVTTVQVTDSNFTPVQETAVDANVTGYVSIFGASFEVGTTIVRFGGTQSPQVSVVDYSEIHAVVPPLAAGTYDVTVIKNGTQFTLPNGIVTSNIPAWTTPQDLGYVFANIAFERQFVAAEGVSNIVYEAVTTTYSLPPSTSLSTEGLFSGTITQDIQNTPTTYAFEVLARDEQFQDTVRLFNLNYLSEFTTGNKSASSLLLFSRNLGPAQTEAPQSGIGTLTIGGQYISPYEVTLKKGDQNLSSFTSTDWFSSTSDGWCSFIKVFGHMNIDAGITFRPNPRKLFTVVHVTGDLTLNGTISMSQRGANHGSSGSGISAKSIQVNDTASIGATGTSGGSSVTSSAAASGIDGTDAPQSSVLQTGGGGSGGVYADGAYNPGPTSGKGASGTSFSGGSGGGAIYVNGVYGGPASGDGVIDGGPGGGAIISGVGPSNPASAGGGGGNPGGSGASVLYSATDLSGFTGSGGILIVIVEGTIYGSGTIEARGAMGGTFNSQYGVSGGGGSGGGIAVLMAKQNQSTVSIDASGGAGGASYGQAIGGTPPGGKGGNGGNGSTLVVAL
jgi:hypothetical protein